MNFRSKRLLVHLFLLLTVAVLGMSQTATFTKAPLVTLPGKNTSPVVGFNFEYGIESVLAWVNVNADTHTIYRMDLNSTEQEPEMLIQTEDIVTNLSVNREGKVCFDQFDGQYWSLMHRGISGMPSAIQDSLSVPSQPSIHRDWLSWIENGSLFVKHLNWDMSNVIMIDSSHCRKPDLRIEGSGNYWSLHVIYEYGPLDNPQVRYAILDTDEPDPQISLLNGENQGRNPSMGLWFGCAYELFLDDRWHVVMRSDIGDWGTADTTMNQSYNVSDPSIYFGYWLVRRDVSQDFGVAVSDSIEGNLEVVYHPIWYGGEINLSDMPGDDTSPVIAWVSNDSIAVVWEHATDTGSELWWAKDRLDMGSVKEVPSLPRNLNIISIYPNPFNTNTTINYSLWNPEIVQVTIYDLAGRVVVDQNLGRQEGGTHEFKWNAQDMPSAVYVFRLKAGTEVDFRKSLLLK